MNLSEISQILKIPLTLPQTVMPEQFNISVPTTQNSPAAATANPLFTYQITSDNGALIGAFAVDTDAKTQANYVFLISIKNGNNQYIIGNNNGPATYQPLPPTGGYNPIPEGSYIYVPNGTILQVLGYYTGSSGSNGEISVSALIEQLVYFQPLGGVKS